MKIEDRLIVALDYPGWQEAQKLVESIPEASHFKVGLELYLATGGAAVASLRHLGKQVFLDLKFHDIPQTVAGAVGQAVIGGAGMMNVHCAGGSAMLKAAVEARDKASLAGQKPVLIGVTVLTSLDGSDLAQIGFAGDDTEKAAIRLAGLARDCGLDGVVCSPHEIDSMRKAFGKGFRLVTPGVRPRGADKADQKRVFTPKEAMLSGADYIVVGRPITKAADAASAFRGIISEMEDGIR